MVIEFGTVVYKSAEFYSELLWSTHPTQ